MTRQLEPGEYTITELVDIDRLESMLRAFTDMSGLTAGLASYPEQQILIAAGWRDICAIFHRNSKETGEYCRRSNIELTSELHNQSDIKLHRCANGIVYGAVPVIVDGRHMASLLAGQVFLEPPDEALFRQQAQTCGFDVKKYLLAVRATPVIIEDELRHALAFLREMAAFIVEQGLRKFELQHSQQDLRKNQALINSLVDSLPDMVWLKDPDGVFLFCSTRFEQLFGASEEDIIGKTDYDFIAREEADYFREKDLAAIEAGAARQNEEEVTFASDGHKEILETVKTPLFGAEGELIGVLGVARDITERKRVQDALRDSEHKYRLLVENQTDMIVKVDLDGRFLFISPSYCKMFGKTEAELLGKSFVPLIHEDDREPTQEAMKALFAPPYTAYIEQRAMTAQGWRWLAWADTSVLDENSEVIEIIGVGRDVTERKEIERAVRESEQRLQALINSTPDIICFKDGEGRWLVANDADIELFGLQGVDYRGKTDAQLADFAAPIYREAFLACAESDKIAWEKREVSRFEEIIPSMDGEVRTFDVIKAPTYDHNGDRRGLVVLARDVTERKQAEEERMHLEEQLQQAQKMESVGRLAGGVAHDFNNMLGVILGNAELALSQIDPKNSLVIELEEIYKAAERSANLTKQLLAFARKQTVAPVVLDLNHTVKGMLNMLRRLIGEDVELTWRGEEGLWPIKIDPSQIDQILANLCVNARDALGESGKVSIETRNVVFEETDCVDAPDFSPGAFVQLIVSDNGQGIDREILPNIFDPYFTTKEMGKGTGLGLATVYGIARQNNGFIHVTSQPGEGTTFNIYLPRYILPVERKLEPPPSGEIVHGQETVLLVEDEPAILHMARRLLQKQGYIVLAASKPGEALRMAEAHPGPIDLLITDVVMPEINGRDLAKNLLRIHPNMRRLFMSGYTADVIAHHGVLDPGVNFLQKPFNMRALSEKIREVMKDE